MKVSSSQNCAVAKAVDILYAISKMTENDNCVLSATLNLFTHLDPKVKSKVRYTYSLKECKGQC